MICKKCGEMIQDGQKFCSQCGAAQDDAQGLTQNEKTINENISNVTTRSRKAITKKAIAAVVGGMSIVLLVIGLILAFVNGNASNAEAIGCYMKDGNLYINYIDDFESQKITKKLIDTDSNPWLEEWNIFNDMQYNNESNFLIYPDRINQDGFTLFHINTKPKNIDKNDPIKIDSHVTAYWVADNAKKIYYITEKANGGDETLNYYDFKESVEIATAPDISFYMNSDGSIAIYTTYSNDARSLYVIEESYKPKEIATDVGYITYTNEDLSMVILKNSGTFYRLIDGKIFEELSALQYDEETTNCYIRFIDTEGNIYYSKSEERVFNIADYIEDDCAIEDSKIEKPEGNDTKYWSRYYSYSRDSSTGKRYLQSGMGVLSDDGEEVWVRSSYNNLYQRELEAYEEKEQRNSFRISIKNQTATYNVEKLYMYNGNKTIELCDYYDGSVVGGDGVYIYKQYDISNIEKMKLSEVYGVDSITNALKSKLFTSNDNRIYYSSTQNSNNIIYSGALIYSIRLHNDYLYYIENPYGDKSGDLYKLKVVNSKSNVSEKIASDVYSFTITESGKVITFRDPVYIGDSLVCDLYLDDEKVDSDVLVDSVQLDEKENLYYGTDYISDVGYTVMMCDGKESVKIIEDIASYAVLKSNYVYYLTNFDEDDSTYELILHTNEEDISISEHVELFDLIRVK